MIDYDRVTPLLLLAVIVGAMLALGAALAPGGSRLAEQMLLLGVRP
jgi:hypothetical protein